MLATILRRNKPSPLARRSFALSLYPLLIQSYPKLKMLQFVLQTGTEALQREGEAEEGDLGDTGLSSCSSYACSGYQLLSFAYALMLWLNVGLMRALALQVAELSARLSAVSQEKARLESRNTVLEKVSHLSLKDICFAGREENTCERLSGSIEHGNSVSSVMAWKRAGGVVYSALSSPCRW